MSRRRERPADFAERASEMTTQGLCQHYKAGFECVSRWIDEIGGRQNMPSSLKRSCPADFGEHAHIENNKQLAQRYACGTKVIARWRIEAGIPVPYFKPQGQTKTPVPDGFRLAAPQMTRTELRDRYNVGIALVDRWLRECGISARREQRNALRVVASMGKRKVASAMVAPVYRDMSLVGRAAEHIRPLAPIVRCDEDGRINPSGKFWLRGGRYIKTDAEVLDLAYRKGFDPDAWKRLGAAA